MAHARRRALSGLLAAGLLLSLAVGTVQATVGSYTITMCYDAANVDLGGPAIVIHQVWSGVDIDEVTGGVGGKRGGFGFDNTTDGVPATSGDETDTLAADPHAKIASAAGLWQGQVVGSLTINKIKGSWAKSMTAC